MKSETVRSINTHVKQLLGVEKRDDKAEESDFDA